MSIVADGACAVRAVGVIGHNGVLQGNAATGGIDRPTLRGIVPLDRAVEDSAGAAVVQARPLISIIALDRTVDDSETVQVEHAATAPREEDTVAGDRTVDNGQGRCAIDCAAGLGHAAADHEVVEGQ